MKKNFHLFYWLLACACLGVAGGRAWAVAIVAQKPVMQGQPQGQAQGPFSPPPQGDVSLESPILERSSGNYLLLTPPKNNLVPPGGYTLLICLRGAGETAEDFARSWTDLVKNQSDVMVASPNSSDERNFTSLVAGIINQTVEHNHVNRKHVILVGFSSDGQKGSTVVGARPDLFAGFGLIATTVADGFFTPTMKKSAEQMPLFYAQGNKADLSDQAFAFAVAQLKYFGFTNILTDRPDGVQNTPADAFNQMTARMMSFFDQALAAQDKREKELAAMEPTPVPAPVRKIPANTVGEKRTLAQAQGTYIFLAPGKDKAPPANGYTLLICLHGVGDIADDFAKNWASLVNSRADVVVAVPASAPAFPGDPGYLWNQPPTSLVAAIIDDTVARYHVNPGHVILVGHDRGGVAGAGVLGARPDLFAGFAGIATDFSTRLFTPTLQKHAAKIAVYYAVGTNDGMFRDVYAPNLAQFKNYGFTNFFAESPYCGHALAPDEMAHMMAFFDRALAAKDQREAAQTEEPASDTLVAQRTLANPKGSYVFLTPDRRKFPIRQESTLLICLPDKNDTADNFAKIWMDLVDSRVDVVVAVPNLAPAAKDVRSLATGQNPTDLIAAIIDDTVARDHVNPKHVILVAYGAGGAAGGKVLGERPDLFAGYAGIGTSFPPEFFTPALRKNIATPNALFPSGANGHAGPDASSSKNIAVYYAVGTRDETYKDAFAPALRQLKSFGLSRLQSEQPNSAHVVTPDEITHLMAFFDQVLEANEPKPEIATLTN